MTTHSIEEMVDIVEQWLYNSPTEHKKEFTDCSENDLIQYHSTLGRYIRNHFRLWENDWTPELEHKNGMELDMSPNHPDAISMKIITQVWKRTQL